MMNNFSIAENKYLYIYNVLGCIVKNVL